MSTVLISPKAYTELTEALAGMDHRIALQGPKSAVSKAIACHPDIYVCKLGTSPKSPVFQGDLALLGPDYPKDVLYNAVVTEQFLICNTKTISPQLVSTASQLYPGIITINVAQGYTKCNMVVVDERHFITEDEGIYKAIEGYNRYRRKDQPEAFCILVKPGFVELPGYPRGFIGGASGRVGNEIWFNGDISAHLDWLRIKGFIESCGLSIRLISGRPLTDIGSIIEEDV